MIIYNKNAVSDNLLLHQCNNHAKFYFSYNISFEIIIINFIKQISNRHFIKIRLHYKDNFLCLFVYKDNVIL